MPKARAVAVVRAQRRVALGVAAAAEGGAPDAPALIEEITARRVCFCREFGKDVTRRRSASSRRSLARSLRRTPRRRCRQIRRCGRRRRDRVSSDRNMFMALKVACCDPVPSSPETCVRPAGVSEAKSTGMPPVALKKLVSVLATFCWLTLRPPAGLKLSAKVQIDVVGVVAEACLQVWRHARDTPG